MYEAVKYTRNFVKEVIVRIDFMSPLEKNKNKIQARLNKEIMKLFSIPETQETIMQDVEIKMVNGKPVSEMKTEKMKEFHYKSATGEKELVITREAMYISYKKYDTFEDLKTDFMKIASHLLEIETDLQIKRIGLRYINSVELSNGEPTDWDGYIDDRLISALNFYEDKKSISRAFTVLELNNGDFKLRYQFGMHNPDYPTPIYRKVFILDMDAFYEGLIEKIKEVEEYLENFHGEIQRLFEASIKQGLRDVMS